MKGIALETGFEPANLLNCQALNTPDALCPHELHQDFGSFALTSYTA